MTSTEFSDQYYEAYGQESVCKDCTKLKYRGSRLISNPATSFQLKICHTVHHFEYVNHLQKSQKLHLWINHPRRKYTFNYQTTQISLGPFKTKIASVAKVFGTGA